MFLFSLYSLGVVSLYFYSMFNTFVHDRCKLHDHNVLVSVDIEL